MSTIKPVLCTHHKPNANDEFPVQLRIYHNKRVLYANVFNFKIIKAFWNDTTSRVKPTKHYPDYAKWNSEIGQMLTIAKRVMNVQIQKFPDMSIDSLRNIILSEIGNEVKTGTAQDCFFKFAEKYIAELKKKKRNSYAATIDTSVKKFRVFYGKDYLAFTQMLEGSFEDTLLEYAEHLREELSTSSVYLYVQNIKRIWNTALSRKLLKDVNINQGNDPFYKFSPGDIKKTKKKESLTLKEIEKLKATAPKKETIMWHAKHMFLLSFHLSGMRFFDIVKLRWEDLTFNADRTGHVTFLPWKTRNTKQDGKKIDPFGIEVTTILSQYNRKGSGFVFPFIDNEGIDLAIDDVSYFNRKINANVNRTLKVLAKRAGIKKNISFHTARHSIAVAIQGAGFEEEEIKDVLGHSDIKVTRRYMKSIVGVDNRSKKSRLLNALSGQ